MSIDTILGLTGTVLGLIGLITGYIFYRKSLRVKEPSIYIVGSNLIQDNVSAITGLEVLYNGQKVETLTVSRIIFWNNGHGTIEKTDLVSANPLGIECTGDNSILDVSIMESNNPASQFSVDAVNNEGFAKISFDYLDKNQGAVIQVIHTGSNSNDISLKGNLKGAMIRKHVKRGTLISLITSVVAVALVMLIVFVTWRITGALETTTRIIISTLIAIISYVVLVYASYRADIK